MSFNPESICFISSNKETDSCVNELLKLYGQKKAEDADVIVVLGGDGAMLRALHHFMNSNKKVYGMNLGSVGFLMNSYQKEELPKRISCAHSEKIYPLKVIAKTIDDKLFESLAINEVSLFRQSCQASKIEISVDGTIRMNELICDGVLVATPIGSTAYNLSAHGPILPLIAPLIALTPVSSFRPRRWHGALLPNNVRLEFKILEHKKRPVNVAADNKGVNGVYHVTVFKSPNDRVDLLFDYDHSWNDRILSEQFVI